MMVVLLKYKMQIIYRDIRMNFHYFFFLFWIFCLLSLPGLFSFPFMFFLFGPPAPPLLKGLNPDTSSALFLSFFFRPLFLPPKPNFLSLKFLLPTEFGFFLPPASPPSSRKSRLPP